MGYQTTLEVLQLILQKALGLLLNLGVSVSQKGPFLKQPTVSAPPHSSLGHLTPVQFEHQWLAQQGVPEVIH
jgi:hypothetical protein